MQKIFIAVQTVTWLPYCWLHVQLLLKVPLSALRLTNIDTDIYTEFRSKFSDLTIDKVDVERMKSADGKEVSLTCDYKINVLSQLDG